LGAEGGLYDVTFNPCMKRVRTPGFRRNFPGLGGGVREMVFLRFYPGLTGLISVKLAESGKVVRVNSIDRLQAIEHGGNLRAFVFESVNKRYIM
jgi:hypothetical protein